MRWPGIRDRLRAQQESDRRRAEAELESDRRKAKVQQRRERCQAEKQQESHRRQAEAAETEARRATEARAKAQKEQEAQEERLRPLQVAKSRYEREVAELGEFLRELAEELKYLQDQDDEESKNEEQQSWWPVSLIHGKANDIEEQKQLEANERLNRLQSSRIKRIKLEQNEAKLRRQRDALLKVNGKIAAEKDYVEGEMKKAEETRRKEEDEAKKAHRMNVEDERQRMAKAKKERAERKVLEA